MCLRFVLLIVNRLFAWLRLSGSEESWKSAEILLLRHQRTVLREYETSPTSRSACVTAILLPDCTALTCGFAPRPDWPRRTAVEL
jgi:hypothetical protein